MTSITERLIRGMEGIIESVPIAAGIAFGGFIYAKLSDLPTNLVVKAWAIWQVAHTALVTFAIICINDHASRKIVVSVISIFTTGIGLYELQKRNLIGYKMSIFIAAIKLIEIFQHLKNLHSDFELQHSEFELQLNQWVDDEGGRAGEAAECIRKAFEERQEILSLNGFNLKTLPSCIDKLINLKKLCLNNNQLSMLPPEIDRLVNLEGLSLFDNQLSTFPPEIGSLVNLKELYVNNNQLSTLSPVIGSLVNLKELCLGNNQLSKLPPEIGSLVNLKELDLHNNQLSTLPPEIGSLVNLKELYLDNNQLSMIPPEIGSLVNLEWLSIIKNQLSMLPPETGNLVKLKGLSIINNQLSTLPPEIGRLVNLKWLYLNYNQLTSISSQIGRLSNLQTLDVNQNPDLDDLPLSLGQCSRLVTIDTDQTKIPYDRVRAILDVCRSERDKNALTILPSRIAAWQKVAGTSFDLKFITDTESNALDLTDKDKMDICEWLVRLERTHDFSSKSQKELAKAVCEMLKSLADSSSFKESFFAQISSNLEGCGDRSSMAFNELYLTWKLDTLDPSTSEKDKLSLMVQAAKTAALHKALQKRIETEGSKSKVDVGESVEIYLYYEIQLKSKLNLLSFITGMLYGDIGKRSWIDENDLIKEVNNTYLDEMIEFSSLAALRNADKSFTSLWKPFQEKFGEQLEEIENQKDELLSQEYLEKIDELQIERTAEEHQQTLHWLEDKLKKDKII